MSTILYRFNHTESFPLLESFTTASGEITTRVQGNGDEAALVVSAKNVRVDSGDGEIVLALPPRAMDGDPKEMVLEIIGDASGCVPFLEAVDGNGEVVKLLCNPVNFTGKRDCPIVETCRVYASKNQSKIDCDIVLPLTFYRFGLTIDVSCRNVSVGLIAVFFTGEVRLFLPGIAALV